MTRGDSRVTMRVEAPLPQIRPSFSQEELDMIERYRGGLPLNAWLRSELSEAIYEMPPEVPARVQTGKAHRTAPNLSAADYDRIERLRGTVPAAVWARDVILRKLWARGERWGAP